MCQRDETRDSKGNRQMPKQLRIQPVIHMRQREYENRDAKQPAGTADDGAEKWQTNDTPARHLKRGLRNELAPLEFL